MNDFPASRTMTPCRPVHRLFFALRPPPAAASYLYDSCSWLGPLGRRDREDRLHVTLNILDDRPVLPPALLDRMIGIGDAVAADPFRVVFNQLSGSGHSVVLRPSERIAALHRFQRRLAEALAAAGVETRRDTRFSPHLTLLYRGWPGLVAGVDAVSWTVEEFVLIESLVGWTEHVVHRRWRLAGQPSTSAPRRGCRQAAV